MTAKTATVPAPPAPPAAILPGTAGGTVVSARTKGPLARFLDRILLLDLFAGLSLTARHLFFRKKETVQYPEERMEPSDRFRGMFRLDAERCIACTLCARDCPIDIIYIDVSQRVNPDTGRKEKVLDRFDIDVQRCMFCGLCEEGCPTEPKSIWLTTKSYELATFDRWQNLYVDMDGLEHWQVRPDYTDREIE
jgi:NADH-quinone oxidoreductase subunit I